MKTKQELIESLQAKKAEQAKLLDQLSISSQIADRYPGIFDHGQVRVAAIGKWSDALRDHAPYYAEIIDGAENKTIIDCPDFYLVVSGMKFNENQKKVIRKHWSIKK